MMRRAEITSYLIALVLLVRSVRADAPLEQYKTFGAGDRVIIDTQTNLEWDRKTSGRFSEAGARTACAASGQDPERRLPTVKELLSIVDEVRHKEQIGIEPVELAVDGAAFGGMMYAARGDFWTSTQGGTGGFRLLVNIETGEVSTATMGTTASVRCVRYFP
jgi:hypothetical protein